MPTPDPAPPTTTATLPHATARAVAPSSAPPDPFAPKPLVHPWLRWPLRAYATLIGALVSGVVYTVLGIPISEGFTDYGAHALDQVAALLTLAQNYPTYTAAGAVVLLALFGLSALAQREANREAQAAADARNAAVTDAEVDRRLPEVTTVVVAQVNEIFQRAVDAGVRATKAANARARCPPG